METIFFFCDKVRHIQLVFADIGLILGTFTLPLNILMIKIIEMISVTLDGRVGWCGRGASGGRGVLVDAHDERWPVQGPGRRWLEREQPVMVGGVRPRRERD